MLTAHTSDTAAKVLRYFIETQSLEAYYSDGQEFNGFWHGQAAKLLGIGGRVDKEGFTRLCHNLHPVTGEQLTERMKGKRRVGTDFTFGVPKSVSLAFMYSKDERIVQALRQAVHDTAMDIQAALATRVRKNGQAKDRLTQNLVGAEFVHLTARPENGIPDPHLHVHLFVFNATWDEVENQWKATQMADIIREIDYYNKLYLDRLASNLKQLGLEITPTEKSFEIAGVLRKLVEKFSKRTLHIEEEARLRGITDNKEKAKLALVTREKKVKTLLVSELEPVWWKRLSGPEKTVLEGIKTVLARSRAQSAGMKLTGHGTALEMLAGDKTASSEGLGRAQDAARLGQRVSMNWATRAVARVEPVAKPTEHDRRAVALAIEHVFERESVVTEKKLIAEAFNNWCLGRATMAGVKQVLAETSLLRVQRGNELLVTTAEVLAEESRIIDACLSGKWKFSELNRTWQITDEKLNRQQMEAVQFILNSRDWVVGISGKAGTGKTTLLHEARRGIEAGGQKLLVLAPTSEAARDVLRKQGFENANTVAQILRNEAMQNEYRGAVWWVDEAGLLSVRQADKLLALAAECKARLVFVGDTGQHHAVERGQAYDLLQKYAHMEVVSIDEIQRQRGAYKKFVELVAAERIEEAMVFMREMGWVREMSLDERKIALAHDYVAIIEAGKTAQVVAPTHRECAEVTEGIRQELKEKELLGPGAQWDILRNLSYTDAQKRDPEHYQRGLVVQINDHVKGFALGEQIEIKKIEKNSVLGRTRDGRSCKIPLAEPRRFSVYEKAAIEVCAGERIRITSNGRSADRHPLDNGKHYRVASVSPNGEMVLENGWHLGKDFKHIHYSYAETSHAVQGKTVDHVLVSQSAEFSGPASNQNQFYVSTSRGSQGMTLYTDSFDLLAENVLQKRPRLMATEILAREGGAEKVGDKRRLARCLGAVGERMMARELVDGIKSLDLEFEAKNGAAGKEAAPSSELLGTQAAGECARPGALAQSIEPAREELAMEM